MTFCRRKGDGGLLALMEVGVRVAGGGEGSNHPWVSGQETREMPETRQRFDEKTGLEAKLCELSS